VSKEGLGVLKSTVNSCIDAT